MTVWICDVNGVLIDSTALVYEAFVTTAARFRLDFHRDGFEMVKRLPLRVAYAVLARGAGAIPELCDAHRRYVLQRMAGVHAYPGVRETLAEARAAGVRIGALTSYGTIAEAALIRTGLYPLIDCLVTDEEVAQPKPSPEGIRRLLSLLGDERRGPVAPDVVHVGDTVADIEAGRAAGVRTVAVSYGVSTEAQLRRARPDDVIDSFAAMRLLLPRADVGIATLAATRAPGRDVACT